MTVESAADRAVFFNADEFGVAATYTPPIGGGSTACVVLFSRADREVSFGESRPIVEGATIAVAADLVTPVKGGTFTIAGTAHKVISDPENDDADRAVWRCTVAP